MEHKTITVNELVKNGLENDIAYTIEKEPPLRVKVDSWLRKHNLDSYSIRRKLDYMKGITRDLRYKNTIDKCDDTQYIRFIWVEGYSKFMEFKHPNDIDKGVARKVNKLLIDNKVGYLIDDSCGCQLACRSSDYETLCKYLNVECDMEDNKEAYCNDLFDDIKDWFGDYCELTNDVDDRILYDVIRYITVNISRYVDLLMSAREWTEEDSDNGTFWIDRLWNEAYKDYKNVKKGYVAWK